MSWPTDEMVTAFEDAPMCEHERESSPYATAPWGVEFEPCTRCRLAAALTAAPREWGVRWRYKHGDETGAIPYGSEGAARAAVADLHPDSTIESGEVLSRSAPGPWEPSPSDEQETQP